MTKPIDRIFRTINQLIDHFRVIEALTLEDSLELEGNETLEWVSQTYRDHVMQNLYLLKIPNENEFVFITEHGDGGYLIGVSGPWDSIEQAKASIRTKEGWTDMKCN